MPFVPEDATRLPEVDNRQILVAVKAGSRRYRGPEGIRQLAEDLIQRIPTPEEQAHLVARLERLHECGRVKLSRQSDLITNIEFVTDNPLQTRELRARPKPRKRPERGFRRMSPSEDRRTPHQKLLDEIEEAQLEGTVPLSLRSFSPFEEETDRPTLTAAEAAALVKDDPYAIRPSLLSSNGR